MDNRKTCTRMIILALETSHPRASLCLAQGEQILFSAKWEAERNHDAFLFPALRQAMDKLGEQKLDLILVGAGPGSYGGIRVALAAATGISMAKQAQVAALCSWDSLASDGVGIISDARRGGWTLRKPSGEIAVLSHEELLQEMGRGLAVYSTETEEALAHKGIKAARSGLIPTAEGLVRIWHNLSPRQQKERIEQAPEPIYVRPPHITKAKRKPWEIHH